MTIKNKLIYGLLGLLATPTCLSTTEAPEIQAKAIRAYEPAVYWALPSVDTAARTVHKLVPEFNITWLAESPIGEAFQRHDDVSGAWALVLLHRHLDPLRGQVVAEHMIMEEGVVSISQPETYDPELLVPTTFDLSNGGDGAPLEFVYRSEIEGDPEEDYITAHAFRMDLATVLESLGLSNNFGLMWTHRHSMTNMTLVEETVLEPWPHSKVIVPGPDYDFTTSSSVISFLTKNLGTETCYVEWYCDKWSPGHPRAYRHVMYRCKPEE